MIEPAHDPNDDDLELSLRELQEVEMETSFKFASAEFALAREAADVSRAFRQADLPFDPRTFVGIRVLESCVAERLDPVTSLRLPTIRELIDRSAELAATLLASRG
jgi:hypothetical protein